MDSRRAHDLESAIAAQRAELQRNAAQLAVWLTTPEPLWSWRPAPGAWSVAEILEHVALTQHYLLLLIEKLARRSAAAHARGEPLPTAPSPMAAIDALAARDFAWQHPEHMTPRGELAREPLAQRLAEQTRACLGYLDAAPHGEGALARLRMSVVDAHLDLYQYLYVLDRHAARHLRQLERNRAGRGP